MSIYNEIKNDKQIWKFCFYGLLKNLKFFEPYLWIYFLSLGLSLLKIGLLFSIREIITYIFEIPSGIFADNYGRKKELMICFIFYMISFILFFIGTSFYFISIGMVFFGLGEAFRSGTHKAMIYSYLEDNNWFKYKTFVYGRTRSFSLIGSSISAFLSILFILNLPGMKWIFLICIIPYIIDFLLIWSYPNSLNGNTDNNLNLKNFFKQTIIQLKNIFTNNLLTKILISSSLYDGIFKSIKDYIQPILELTILTAAASTLNNFDGHSKVKIYLGLIYGVFYIFSSFASKNVYKLNNYFNSSNLMNYFFDIMGVLCFILAIAIKKEYTLIIIIIFFILYLLKDARRPLVVDVCGDCMNKNERATVMSVDSQLKSLFSIILAPLLGYTADKYSIGTLFLIVGILIIIINRFLYVKSPE